MPVFVLSIVNAHMLLQLVGVVRYTGLLCLVSCFHVPVLVCLVFLVLVVVILFGFI
jgi:hypothetical protein